MTPSKKAPIDWSDEDADQVLKSVLSVVSHDMRKAAERDIRDLMARAWLLGEATRTPRPKGTESTKAGYANGYATAIETAAQVCETLASVRYEHARGPFVICATNIRRLLDEQRAPQPSE